MSLGLLAKDSIQDLETLGKEGGRYDAAVSKKSSSLSSDNGEGDSISMKEEVSIRENRDVSGEGSSRTEAAAKPQQAAAAANPQQAQEEEDSVSPRVKTRTLGLPSATKPSHGQYAGFGADYDYQAYQDGPDADYCYQHDTYAPNFLGEKQQQFNLLWCLFPWTKSQQQVADEPAFQAESYETKVSEEASRPTMARLESDDEVCSNGSDALGEKLSDKERQAVLARLRLVQPDASMTPDSPGEKKKGLLNGIPTYDTSPLDPLEQQEGSLEPKPLKGILKHRSSGNMKSTASLSKSSNKDEPVKRRSLFPSYETSAKSRNNNNVKFAPMARVMTVKSKNDMLAEEKADIWWQKSDYEDFRKTGRIITKAMLEGGSEIWLASNESWWHGKNTTRTSTLKHAFSISEKNRKPKQQSDSSSPGSDRDSGDMISATGDKWWHKFGHSRRGLEHVVSLDEGRQRQMNVRIAIRAVLEEQARQKLYHREDPEKLRIVSLHHTSWARDLAFAAGSSDADAVRSSFAQDRKSREFFLLKMARTSPRTKTGPQIPQFMQPAMHGISASATHRLDANTAAQIRFRQQRQQQLQGAATEVEKAVAQQQNKKPPAVQLPSPQVSSEPIHDPLPDETHEESLAARAAGFSAEGDEKVNMAAVLSGMGAVPQATPTVVAS